MTPASKSRTSSTRRASTRWTPGPSSRRELERLGRNAASAVGARSFAHEALEGFAEGRFGVVANAARDIENLGVGGLQEPHGGGETVALQVAQRSGAHTQSEACGETGSRQIGFASQRRHRPGMLRALMDGAQDSSDAGISQNSRESVLSVGSRQHVITYGAQQKGLGHARHNGLLSRLRRLQLCFDAIE